MEEYRNGISVRSTFIHYLIIMKSTYLYFSLLAALLIASCGEDNGVCNCVLPPPEVVYSVEFKNGNESLEAGDTVLIDDKQLIVERIQFYLGDFTAKRGDSSDILIREVEFFSLGNAPEDNQFIRTLAKGDYTGLNFSVGINETLNQGNTAQWNAGDPLSTSNNMYWPMGGYIFSKFEGRLITDTVISVIYHIGREANRRDLTFDENFSIIGGNNVVISFDVQKLFGADGGTSINPATQNETHTMNDPQLAGIIANNYANAFSVTFPQ